MLYILPPPRTPNPPSPWQSILCTNNGQQEQTENNLTHNQKSRKRPPPPRIRLRHLHFSNCNQQGRNNEALTGPQDDNMDTNRNPKSLSECYFAGKGTALVLPAAAEEAQKSSRMNRITNGVEHGTNIRVHLQAIVDLLRPEETLKMAVKLESVHPTRIRYLVIISKMGSRGVEESCLLGIDSNEQTTVGLVLKVMADTDIRLDGDGGFSLSVCNRHHIFKPVSVQAMWSALQTLHKVSSKAREQNYFQGGLSHDWVNYYEERIESDRSCLNEWHTMDNLESRRPPSPDSVRTKPTEREETEHIIRMALKEIMMSVDLDEVTSKYIRTRLEEHLDMDFGEFKSFIDQEMLTILGQMDAPTEIFEHVYLGSEWNASNYEELQRNGVGHILNVTREIDNFFPGTFDYLNVRVYDDEKTDLLKHWDDTFKYINRARMSGSKVLVHCKMGVSRSASVVIAYAMKAYNWDFATAMHHVKAKRTCIKPNTAFLTQLETYQGILDAMKNKDKLQRSKSETNLKLNNNVNISKSKVLAGSEPTPMLQALAKNAAKRLQTTLSGQDLGRLGARPKSWSPDLLAVGAASSRSSSYSLEDLSQRSASKESVVKLDAVQARHVLMPDDNGESYSVSPNQIVHLPGKNVKERVSDLEAKSQGGCDCETSCETGCEANCEPIGKSELQGSEFAPPAPYQSSVADEPTWEGGNRASRQGSWSSYDSAVVLRGLSRHSSWGSGDSARPTRNSSWGSYDLRPTASIAIARGAPRAGALSASAPGRCCPEAGDGARAGLVKNLAKEFEAKTEGEERRRGSSVPSSPVVAHAPLAERAEEPSIRDLVGRFERPRLARECVSPVFGAEARLRPPSGVVRTVVRKKEQYGKSHPLAMLKKNSVYNTM